MTTTIKRKFYGENNIIRHYTSAPTYSDVVVAKKFDRLLQRFFNSLTKKLKKEKLLQDKKKDIEFWYIVGSSVREFIDSEEFKALDIPNYDLKNVFESMENYARVESDFFEKKEESKRQSTFLRNNFYRAYKLAQFSEDYIKKVGSWDTWREFLERPMFNRDKQLLKKVLDSYLSNYNQQIKRAVARKIIKNLNERLKGYDTKFMPEEKLDKIINEVVKSVE